MKQYMVKGMSCASCQMHVEKAVSKVKNVQSVNVSLLTNRLTVEGEVSDREVLEAVMNAGYQACAVSEKGEGIVDGEELLQDKETPALKKRLFHSLGWLLLLMYITMGHNMWGWPLPDFLERNPLGLAMVQMLVALIVIAVNRNFIISGFRSFRRRTPNMDTLVALGTSASFLWSLFVLFQMTVLLRDGAGEAEIMMLYHQRLYFETAAMIPTLITVGKTLEAFSKGKTTDALKGLMQMAPRTAFLEREGVLQEVAIREVLPGDIFVVRPGEAVPVDGIILEGMGAVDESALTGESIPVDKGQNDKIFAATLNQSGFLRAQATRVGEDTAFSQIIQMVSEASATKAPIDRIADTVSGYFVPGVIVTAFAVFGLWILRGSALPFALEKAIAVLVISCPCALGLATPVAIMVGNGVGAKNGILFKTAAALENTARLQIVALDKTGTITAGKPVVSELYAQDISPRELLKIAYSLERKSEHPLAKALVAYAQKEGIIADEVSEFQAVAGNGISAVLAGKVAHAGSERYIRHFASIPESFVRKALRTSSEGKTPLFFEREGKLLGMITVADTLKEDSASAIGQLHKMGLEVIMLTGDNERSARFIAEKAGVNRVFAGILPQEKAAKISELSRTGKVAMVGDGINDAPALKRADIGMAVASGSDIALDSADVVLMNSRLSDVAATISLSRATLRNIHENLFWAFAYNAILIPVAAGVFSGISITPLWGAAAMSLSSLTVCLNALRLNRHKMHFGEAIKMIERKNGGEEDSREGEEYMKKTVLIQGMMCEHCAATVKKTLEALEGVVEADVSHTKNKAVLTLSQAVAETQIKEALAAKDYTFVGMDK